MSGQSISSRTLQITFDATAEYAAFIHSDIDQLTVVTSRTTSADGGGSIDDSRLSIVVDGDGVVADMEIFTKTAPFAELPKLTDITQRRDQVEVLVAFPFSTVFSLNRGTAEAWIGLSANPPVGDAVRLGGSGIVLSLRDGNILEGFFISCIVVDPTGEYEEAWLGRFSIE